MPFPTLFVIAANVITLAIFLPVIRLLSHLWRIRSKPIGIQDPKSGATLASLIILLSFVAVFSWRAVTHMFQLDTCSHIFSLSGSCPTVVIDAVDLPWMLILQAPVLFAVFIAVKETGQNRASLGLARKEWRKMLALGGTVSAIFVVISGLLAPLIGGGFAGFSAMLALGLAFYTIVGFSEEIIWRGYVQSRLCAYAGGLTGLIVTSLLFAVLWHFPAEYYAQSGAVLPALASTLTRLSPGLLFGYLMLRSQNIIPSAVFHVFWDWNLILWQVPSA